MSSANAAGSSPVHTTSNRVDHGVEEHADDYEEEGNESYLEGDSNDYDDDDVEVQDAGREITGFDLLMAWRLLDQAADTMTMTRAVKITVTIDSKEIEEDKAFYKLEDAPIFCGQQSFVYGTDSDKV